MTRKEISEVLVDIFTEYLPKNISKSLKEEVAAVAITELHDLGGLRVEDEDEDEESPGDPDELPF